MTLEPAHHRIDELGLEIEGRRVAWDPVLTAPLEHGADVLMLELDRAPRPIDHRLQQAVMLGFTPGPPGDAVDEHREIVHHDRVGLLIGTVTSYGSSRASQRRWKRFGSCQQLRRRPKHRPGIGKPLVERVHCGAMLQRDSEMQRVTGAKPQAVLIGKPRR